MILAEKKLSNDIRLNIENNLMQRYKVVYTAEDYICFSFDNKVFFKISKLKWKKTGEEVIVAEYADSEFEARKGLFGEDGDMFYINEMSEEEIEEAIIKEVEQ